MFSQKPLFKMLIGQGTFLISGIERKKGKETNKKKKKRIRMLPIVVKPATF